MDATDDAPYSRISAVTVDVISVDLSNRIQFLPSFRILDGGNQLGKHIDDQRKWLYLKTSIRKVDLKAGPDHLSCCFP